MTLRTLDSLENLEGLRIFLRVDLNVPLLPMEVNRGAAVSDAKMPYGDPLKPVGQMGLAHLDHAFGGVNINGEAGLQHEKDSATCPGLRCAGGREGHRSFAGAAGKAAEELRHAKFRQAAGYVEQTTQDLCGLLPHSVSGKSRRDDGTVVRPDRAIVVGDRIVAAFTDGHRAYAPAAEQVGGHQGPAYAFGSLRRRRPAKKDMTRIRCAHGTLTFAAIQRQRIGADALAPEAFVKGRGQSGRLYRRIQRANPSAPVVEFVGRWRHTEDMRAWNRLPTALERFGLLDARAGQSLDFD